MAVKFSIHLNRHVFVMYDKYGKKLWFLLGKYGILVPGVTTANVLKFCA